MDLDEARSLAVGLVRPLERERIPIGLAVGRILADDFIADRNVPQQNRSRLDGYAIRSANVAGADNSRPVPLRLAPGFAAAGAVPETGIADGEALRILTGAPMPRSADAVVPQEEALVKESSLMVGKPYPKGFGVNEMGCEAVTGDRLLPKGTVLTPTHLALIAAFGRTAVTGFRRPRVALLGTGDELKPLGGDDDRAGTFCNNIHLLSWLVEIHGGEVSHLDICGDDPLRIASYLRRMEADMVISTGGMGRGDRDFVMEAWKRLGVRVLFRNIRIRPGRHSAMGVLDSKVFFGFSGNPWASRIVFSELAVPVLRRLQGLENWTSPTLTAILQESVRNYRSGTRVVRGTLNLQSAHASFKPMIDEEGARFSNLARGLAYILLGPPVVDIQAGQEVAVRLCDIPLLACSGLGIA